MKEKSEIQLRCLPPQDMDAEQAVLGAVLIECTCMDKIADFLAPSDFYKEAHSKIFSAMLRMHEKRESIDLVTLMSVLRGEGDLANVGGASYLAVLVAQVPTAANVKSHARIVHDKALFRRMIHTATDIVTQGYAEPQLLSADEYVDQSEQVVFQVGQGRSLIDTLVPMDKAVHDSWQSIEHRFENRGTLPGISTGLPDLDRMTDGFQNSDLIIIAARPSMGKTALALNIAGHAAISDCRRIAFFSLEMSRDQLTQRLIASEGRVSLSSVRSGNLSEEDWTKLSLAAGRVSSAKLWIDDASALSALNVRARSRRLKSRHGLDMVIVDYLQLMRGTGDNREQEIAGITRSLKALAKELNIPVVALSQLNRSLEQRSVKRPMLADLRESGAIEQDADVILFIYRAEVYDECKCPGECICERRGAAEAIIGKQRNGPTGVVPLTYLREYTRFESRAGRRTE